MKFFRCTYLLFLIFLSTMLFAQTNADKDKSAIFSFGVGINGNLLLNDKYFYDGFSGIGLFIEPRISKNFSIEISLNSMSVKDRKINNLEFRSDDFGNTNFNLLFKWLSITGNFNSNLWCSDETSSLYQILENNTDFDVSTRLYCEWGNNSSDIAGIIIKFPSDTNWISIKFWMHGDSTGRLEFQNKCTDIISPVPGSESSGGTRDIFLRMVKQGNNYTGYYKNNSGDDWSRNTVLGIIGVGIEHNIHDKIFGSFNFYSINYCQKCLDVGGGGGSGNHFRLTLGLSYLIEKKIKPAR